MSATHKLGKLGQGRMLVAVGNRHAFAGASHTGTWTVRPHTALTP
jgi:hypothetical protein